MTEFDPFLCEVTSDEACGPLNVGEFRDNPLAMASTFAVWLLEPGGPDVESLELIVTPESRLSWGDFRGPVEALTGAGMYLKAEFAAPGVVHVPFIPDPGRPAQVHPDAPCYEQEVIAWLTLVRDPRWVGWRVHQLGEKADPAEIPTAT